MNRLTSQLTESLIDEKNERDKEERNGRDDENVFLFVPNLIGYSRILLAMASLKYMPYHPKYCTWLYILSCLLDAFDGMAARWLGQCVDEIRCYFGYGDRPVNNIGANCPYGVKSCLNVLRCTTSCLLCFLSSAYPAHYMHVFSTLAQGSFSHKKIPDNQSWILRQYYQNNIILFVFCAANELFFVALYLLSFPAKSPPRLGYIFNIPLSYPVLIGTVSFPICFGKQIINIIQMVNAAKALVDVDKENRRKAKFM
ncbi:hypothetical protein PMAC_000107 [Pneumocystis sp. 'macacae']|nr:hypothetical protein PMAC_000107 [Pneumocystis sp. 'macacae']